MRMLIAMIPYLIAIAVFAVGGAMLGLMTMGIATLWTKPSPMWALYGSMAGIGISLICLLMANWMYKSMNVTYEQIVHPSGPANE